MPRKSIPSHQHGLRFSLWDALILLAAIILTAWLRSLSFPLWWIVPTALGHFFLFCNVFLVWRRWEFLWAALFILNVALHLTFDHLNWLSPTLCQLPVTLAVLILQIRSPWYHGIFAHRLNPKLVNDLDGTLPTP